MTIGAVILLLVLAAVLFFIVDGIISPSESMIVRMALYKAVDEIDEEIRVRQGEDKFYKSLRANAHSIINNMPRYTVWTLASIKVRLEKDREFRELAERKVQEMDASKDEGLDVLRKHLVGLADKVLFINGMGWMISLIPILLCMIFLDRITFGVKAIMTMSQKTLEKTQPVAV